MNLEERIREGDHQPLSTHNERLLLGSILSNPSVLPDVRVNEEFFISDRHKKIFRAITDFDLRGEPVDVLSVGDYLTRQDGYQQWAADLSIMVDDSFSNSFFESAQKIVERQYRERQIRSIAEDLTSEYDSDTAIQRLMSLDVVAKNYTHTIAQASALAVERIEALSNAKTLPGITSGLKELDDAIAGFQKTDLYVIGGRPSMGKTAFVINMLVNGNVPALFFSTEQPAQQIGLRSMSIQGGISARHLRSAEMSDEDWPRMISAVNASTHQDIIIYDKPNITISQLMREARRIKFNKGIEIIFVDYIQRIGSPQSENRRLEVSDVVKGLKTLARELEVPVVALGQVKREVDTRTDKRPRMADLLESGVIEQEADLVMLLYRDEVYYPDSPDKGILEGIIDKNRHGPIGVLKFAWIGEFMQVKNLYRGF